MIDHSVGRLPRMLTPDILWTGGCVEFDSFGRKYHGHMSSYLVLGSKKTFLVDTGAPFHRHKMMKDVEECLAGRPLDYIFPTHCEYPHAGLLPIWMERYPNAIAVGNLHDYPLFFPKLKDRILEMTEGQAVDLGDRHILFLPAIWRDFKDTMWAFETTSRVMFVADGFAFLHFHDENECDRTTSESATEPTAKLFQHYGETALNWSLYSDVRDTFDDLDELIRMVKPTMIAGAHGPVIDNPELIVPYAKAGLILAGQKGGVIPADTAPPAVA